MGFSVRSLEVQGLDLMIGKFSNYTYNEREAIYIQG